MQTIEKLVPLAEAAEILGISLSTAYRWSSQKKLPIVKVGSKCLIRPETLLEFIAANTRPVASI